VKQCDRCRVGLDDDGHFVWVGPWERLPYCRRCVAMILQAITVLRAQDAAALERLVRGQA
jgi:hypothetical protein